jgi:hypothetical protein
MRIIFKAIALGLIAAGAMFSGAASAHGHVRFGVTIGVPFYPWYAYDPYPYYGYPPYYPAYYPPAVVAEPSPPPTASVPPAPSYWYYCAESKAYYPYVQSCPSPWQPVPAEPPAQGPAR